MAGDRRVRHKVTELGVEDLVSELLARGLTYEDIAARVSKQTGEDIGKSSIARYNNNLQRKLAKIRQVRESAEALGKVIAEKTGNEPDTQMSELLLATMQYAVLDKLGDDELDTKEIVGLSLAGSQTVRAQAAVEKIKENERRRSEKAFEKVAGELKRLLEKTPYWRDIEAIIAGAREDVVGA